jgi:hypothetical protein
MDQSKNPRYTEFIKELEQTRQNLQLEMQEHVFSHYSKFIDIFQEFRSIQSVSIDCYDPCFNSIKSSLKEILAPVSVSKSRTVNSIEKLSPEWWQELPDELDMLLADEKYEECIGIIEEVSQLPTSAETMKHKLDFDVHVLKVIETIAKELQRPQVVVPDVYISYLIRLNAFSAAEDAYFIGKSQQLKLYMRRVTITEAAVQGIPKQTSLFVSLLRSAATESIKLNLSIGKLFSWITEEVKAIAWEIGETLHIVEKIQDLASIYENVLKSFDALESLGLSVTLTFQYSFLPFVQKKIQEIYVKEEGKVEFDIAGELWRPQVIQVEGSNSVLRMSSSCIGVYNQSSKVLSECCLFQASNPKSFAILVPIFLKTIRAIMEKFIESDKFDDRKDSKIVQVIVCNLWNLAFLIPAISKKIAEKLKTPSVEFPDLQIIEVDSQIRGDDILQSFALVKWTEEIPAYLTSLHNIQKLQNESELKNVNNSKHVLFVKEGVEAVSSSTDRNKKRIEKYCKTMVEAYVQVLDEVLHLEKGNHEICEMSLPGFQQMIADLNVLNVLCAGHAQVLSLSNFIEKVIAEFVKIKKVEVLLLRFREDVYKNLFNQLFG